MARAAFWFCASGATIALLIVALPHGDEVDTAGLLAAAAGAVVLASIAAIGFDRLSQVAFLVGTVIASALSTYAIHAAVGDNAYGVLPYFWVTIYAFYFFALPAALVQLSVLAAMYGIELGMRDLGHVPIADWVATIATLATVGVLVSIVRDRILDLISNLTDAARTDPLTGLLNRRGFEEAFDVELERARRADRGLSVIVGDLDRFKLVNDRLGHAAGDEALRQVGKRIRAVKRSWDTAARVGGEEFALIAPDTDEHGAYALAERLRGEIAETLAAKGEGPFTASFGIATAPVHGETRAALLQAADQALYAAKRLGRDRSVISSAEVPGILARGPRSRDDTHVELAMLLDLAEALDVRDSGSVTHCQRVGRLAELIARELALAPEAVERMRIAGILHDVGRVGVPDALLAKPGPLTDSEWELVRSHPEVGARLLDTTEFGEIGEWIRLHHERPDGRGYPDGRSGEELPLEAAILAVADAYEAMTSERPYRQPLDAEAAAHELRGGAGRQFDARVVEALLKAV
jgi:diguanylate cyclase (GGDEF)-like protein